MIVTEPTSEPRAQATAAADARAVQIALRDRLLSLAATVPGVEGRIAVLDEVSAAALALADEVQALYSGRPIPLDTGEHDAWRETVDLWLALAAGYEAILAARTAETPPAVVAYVATRAAQALAVALRQHARVYQLVPPTLWQRLHAAYAVTEALGLADAPVVALPGVDQTPVSCGGHYRSALLAAAANTNALSAQAVPLALRLAHAWRDLLTLSASAPADMARSPLAVDLMAGHGPLLVRYVTSTPALRHLDAERLAQRVREAAAAVRVGAPLEEVKDACAPAPAVLEKLLTHLYVQWCSAGAGRIEERRASTHRAQVAVNMHAIHFQISGRAFRQPGLRYTKEEERDLEVFGHITERTESRLLTTRSSALEPWEIVNQAPTGLLGLNRSPDLHTRLAQGQMVAMRVTSADPPMLGFVQRIAADADRSLAIGVRTLPEGVVARAAAVRPAGAARTKFERALTIDADPDRRQPETLVLAPGTFRPGALFELATGTIATVRLTAITDAGVNFERVTYSLA